MRMDGLFHLLCSRLEVAADHVLRDQLTRMRADNVCTQDLTVLLVADHLDVSLRIAGCARTPTRAPRKYAHLDVEPLITRSLFRQSHRSNLGMAICDARDV